MKVSVSVVGMLAVGNVPLPPVVQEWATFVFVQARILATLPAQVPDS